MLLTSYCANYWHRDFLPAGRQSHRHHVLAQNRRGNISMVPEVFEVQDGTVHLYTYTNKRQVQQLSADTAMVHDMALYMNVLLCNTASKTLSQVHWQAGYYSDHCYISLPKITS